MIKLFKTGMNTRLTLWYLTPCANCDVCNQRIHEPNGAYIVDWNKQGEKKEFLIHFSCLKYFVIPLGSVIQNRFNVIFAETLHWKAVPIFIQTPCLKDYKGGTSVFNPEIIEADVVVNNAWRSKKYASLEGAVVGDPLVLDKIEERQASYEKKLLEGGRG